VGSIGGHVPGKAPVLACRRCGLLTPLPKCPECGAETEDPGVAPPAEVRPLGEPLRRFVREVLRREGIPKDVVPRDEPLWVNRAPEFDVLEEVVSVRPVLALRYDAAVGRWGVVLKEEGAVRLWEEGGASVEVDEGAAAAVSEGKNLFAPGVVAHDDLEPGSWVVVTHRDTPVAFGTVVEGAEEALRRGRGMVVRVKGSVEDPEPRRLRYDLEGLADVHSDYLEGRIRGAVDFLRDVVDVESAFVSVSGGKDSAVAALVASEAGVVDAFYADTGMEFPSTVEAVEGTADALGLDLEVKETGEDVIPSLSERLLPPSRDNRWCTLVAKLKPVRDYVRSAGKSYTVVGVRRFESEARSRRGRVWRSSEVPGQVNVAPVFDFSSLEVWMVLALEGLPVNEAYEWGVNRVGCFMCPAGKIGEYEWVSRFVPSMWRGWVELLEDYSRRHDLPEDWLRLHVWRWLRPEGEIERLASEESLRWGERVLSRWSGVDPEEAALEFARSECPGCGYCGRPGEEPCPVLERSLRRVFEGGA